MTTTTTKENESMTTHRVFVYGSLMTGHFNNRTLRRGGARLLGRATTREAYTMISLGAFPGVLEGGETAISGEVWEVGAACLAALDRLEGHPHFYRRRPVDVEGFEGVVSYFLRPDAGRVRLGEAVPSGDWRTRPRREDNLFD